MGVAPGFARPHSEGPWLASSGAPAPILMSLRARSPGTAWDLAHSRDSVTPGQVRPQSPESQNQI